MAEYIKLYKKFWNNPRVRRLSDDAKLLYLYLISSPHNNMLGYYVLDDNYIVGDIGWNGEGLRERLREAFGELVSEGFCKRDGAARTILITAWFEHNRFDNPNQGKKAQAELSEIPQSTLHTSFMACLEALPEGLRKPLQEQLAKRLLKPETETEAVSVTESVPERRTDISPEPEMKPPANSVPQYSEPTDFHEHAKVLDPPQCPLELKGLELYEADPKLWKDWGKTLAAWKLAYPGVDIVAQIREAHAWEVTNPTRKKVNRKRYLNSWLARAQDGQGPRQPKFEAKPRRREPTADDYQMPEGGTE